MTDELRDPPDQRDQPDQHAQPDQHDNGFEQLATRAGASLRRPPSTEQLERIVARARRQHSQRVAALATAVSGAVVAIMWFAASSGGGAAPPPATVPLHTSVPPTTATPVLPGEAWIAVGMNHPEFRVNLVRPDGTGVRLAAPDLTSTRQVNPDWSPDGTQLAFAADGTDGSVDLWTTALDGSGSRLLVDCTAPCLSVDEPAWSPDGRTLAFQRNAMNGDVLEATLETVDVASGIAKVVRTAPTKTVYLQPRWSPDGGSLVVEVLQLAEANPDSPATGEGIGVIDLERPTAAVRMLTDFAHFAQSPDWSWRDNLIVYAARSVDGGSANDLFVVRPDGTGVRQVTQLAAASGTVFEPTFTPDGARILYVEIADVSRPQRRITSIAVDGSGRRAEAAAASIEAYHPRLRPIG